MSASTDTRTASQRIEDLEKVVTMLYEATARLQAGFQQLPNLQQDSVLLKDALKLINKKTDAIIKLAKPETGINADEVSNLIVAMNVTDLEAQTAEWVSNGSLAVAAEAADDSFVVAQESNKDGVVVNPRIQFRLDSMDPATKESFKGKKVGDSISFGENKFDAKILELYTIVQAQAEQPQAQSAAPAAPAEAPAAETAPVAAEAAPEAPAQTPSIQESPVAFGLEFHGQPEASLAPSADSQTATA